MPSRNIIKTFIANSYYHLYNRGVEKRTIFTDDQDYKVMLSYLKHYLSPPPPHPTHQKPNTYQTSNYFQDIELACFCLMPNHYHFLIKQIPQNGITRFARSLFTRYTQYFNKRHQRTGSLFGSNYKAALIQSDEYLLHLSRYIHLNPNSHAQSLTQAYSSYSDFLGLRHTAWVKPQFILNLFRSSDSTHSHHQTYLQFVQDHNIDSQRLLGKLTLE